MTTFAQDSSNDIFLDANGQLAIVDGKEAYGIIIEDNVRTIRGEYVYDTERGVPYFSTLLGHKMPIEEWIAALQSCVLELDFVVKIQRFEYSYIAHTKTVSYTMSVLTDLGTVEISQ